MVLSNTDHPRHWHPSSTFGNNNKIEAHPSTYWSTSPNDEIPDLLTLPARFGGMAPTNPTSLADLEYSASSKVSNALKNAILQQSFRYPRNVVHKQEEAKGEIRRI